MEKDLITDAVREYGEGRMFWARVGVIFPHYKALVSTSGCPFFPLDRKSVVVPLLDSTEALGAGESPGAGVNS